MVGLRSRCSRVIVRAASALFALVGLSCAHVARTAQLEHRAMSVGWVHSEWTDSGAGILSAMADFPCGLFRPAAATEKPDIKIRVNARGVFACGDPDEKLDERRAAGTMFDCGRYIDIIVERTADVQPARRTHLLLVHELGHAAGLDHDPKRPPDFRADQQLSVMMGDVLNHYWYREYAQLPLPRLDREDIVWLRKRYCRREN